MSLGCYGDRLSRSQPPVIMFIKASAGGTSALDALRAQAAQSPWGVASNAGILDEPRLRSMKRRNTFQTEVGDAARNRRNLHSPPLVYFPDFANGDLYRPD